jgi:SM-20-related protein
MTNENIDLEILDDVIPLDLLEGLRIAMMSGASQAAEVATGGEQRVVERVRRTRSVAVPETLLELTRSCIDDIRPRLERRFSGELASCETPQFLRYERGDRFVAHQDRASRPGHDQELALRRVSVVLFITGQEANGTNRDFAGGLLTFFDTSPTATWETCRVAVTAAAGAAVAFPSHLVHEVTPVRRGQRLTVATWFPTPSAR